MIVFTTEILYLFMNKHYQLSGTSTKSHSLSIHSIAPTVTFFLLCEQPIPLELYTIYHLTVKEVNCVSFGPAPLPFLIFMFFCIVLFL